MPIAASALIEPRTSPNNETSPMPPKVPRMSLLDPSSEGRHFEPDDSREPSLPLALAPTDAGESRAGRHKGTGPLPQMIVRILADLLSNREGRETLTSPIPETAGSSRARASEP